MISIEKLNDMIPSIYNSLRDEIDTWDSLVINRRKPHTTRLFRQFGELRVCCHIFDSCQPDEAFAHPHPWPGVFKVLKGSYLQTIGTSSDLESEPNFLYKELLTAGSMYEILDPHVWHKIQPLERTYTIMANGLPWEGHKEVRTTKGKDLDKLSDLEKEATRSRFLDLLEFSLDLHTR